MSKVNTAERAGAFLGHESSLQHDRISLVLDALGSTTALNILDEASRGLESGKKTIKKLGLTPRMYYRCLKKLNELNIVSQSGISYNLTPFGKALHKLVFNDFSSLITADKLKGPLEGLEYERELKIIDNYRDLVKFLIIAVDQSKSEILLATRYMDLSVTQSLIYALQRGVILRSITNKGIDFLSFFKLLGAIIKNIRPSMVKPLLMSNYKTGDVPLSFVVIDHKICIFEIPTQEFGVAFFWVNERSAKSLSDFFWEIWKKSPTLEVPQTPTNGERSR